MLGWERIGFSRLLDKWWGANTAIAPHEVVERPPYLLCREAGAVSFRSWIKESRENSKLKVSLTPITARPLIQHPIRTVIHLLLALCYLLCPSIALSSSHTRSRKPWRRQLPLLKDPAATEPPLPQQAQTIESISGHTYIRKRISLTFFVKKLILWSERLCQRFLSDATYFVYRAVTFFNEINLHPHSSYYLRNTVKLIRRSSSIIDEYIYPISPRDVKQKAPPHGQCVDN